MKTIGAGLSAHLAQDTTTLATCWKVKRVDGTIMGFTDHDKNLDIDMGDGDGAITYQAATGFTRSAIEHRNAFRITNLDIIGLFDSAAITESDVRAGRYDFAEIKIFQAVWSDTSLGVVPLLVGQLDKSVIREGQFVAELRDIIDRYNTTHVIELHSVDCRADLGDGRCKVQLDPPVWLANQGAVPRQTMEGGLPTDASPAVFNVVRPTSFNDRHFKCVQAGTTGATEPSWNLTIGGTTNDGSVVWETIRALTVEASVLAVTDNRTFSIDYSGDALGGFFDFGIVAWTSGLNNGLRMEVKRFLQGSPETDYSVELFLPMPFDVQTGDTFTMTAGCDKALETCVFKFDNKNNFRGETFAPTNDTIFALPDASA